MAQNRAYGFPQGNQIPAPIPIEEARAPTSADDTKGILGQVWINTVNGDAFIYGGSVSGWKAAT